MYLGAIKSKHRGFSMIEVLVTLVVLSIGLLGLAALQLTSLRSVNSASYRTQATLLIDDIAERMRINVAAVDNNDFMAFNSAAIDCTALPAPYCGEYYDDTDGAVAAANCTSSQLAAYDTKTWFCGVNTSGVLTGGVLATLPGATATITCNDTDPPAGVDADACTDSSPHTISVSWNELNPNQTGGAATTLQTIAVTIQP